MATIRCMVHQAGRISPNRPAFLAQDILIRHGEFDLMVSATALRLRGAGIRQGDRVALYMEDGWAIATLILALIRVGAVACPLNTRLPVQSVKEQLAFIHCRTLISRIRSESRAVLKGVDCHDPDELVSRELASGQATDPFDIPVDQPVSLIFTSGSSGRPKAVLHSYGNHYYSAYGANLNARLQSGHCWLLSLPLYHVGGLGILFRCLQSGAAVAVMNRQDAMEKALAEFPVSHLSLVPTQLARLLRQPLSDEVLRRLKAVLVGGAPASAGLLESARRKGFPVLPTYGLSEMTSQVTAVAPTAAPEERNSAGRVLRHRQMRLASDGEIRVKGQTLFLGYVEGDALRLPVDSEGWFATGDLGTIDGAGNLWVSGRKDRQFVSGGENVAPEEIERALLEVDGIHQAVVEAVPHDEYGQRPVAFLDREETVTDEVVRDALRGVLPTYKVPDAFRAWDARSIDPK